MSTLFPNGTEGKHLKIVQAKDPVKPFQTSAQDNLKQQQVPRNHSQHLTRAQQ
jgi:hypothetical protein